MTATPERPTPATDPYVEAERRRAARALLRTPLLHADAHADDLALVRRHQRELTTMFADGLGYRLVVEPGLARLLKTGLAPDPSRGLRRRNGRPFTPRRYAFLALTLAALARTRQQVMVDEVVAGVRSAAVDAAIDVDLDSVHDRRALHSALVALVDLGVLSERDGDLEHWAERHTESLLDVHRDRLAVLLSAPLVSCEGPADVLAVPEVPSSAGGARITVRRHLVERPVLSVEDLTEEQRGWWRRNREREREWFSRWLGLELEIRAEGALALDPDGELSDLAFPGVGSAKHFALLLLAELTEVARRSCAAVDDGTSRTWVPVATSTARSAGDRVFRAWRRGLRKDHQDDPDALFDEAVRLLVTAGLVRTEGATTWVHAAAARYAPRAELVTAAGPAGERSLFEQEDP
ncbi:TIGR02678 family protein [Ornithinimicrobium sediminis]|uniref:TIGR02678 family protein n=1 Tax=Ornithinimicrobium sediminis TaxID=2904603 RepID=UPI001E3BD9D4|nr:TIGR02678 family protein [Ornithinimicrobium sediminis]MCE0487961.1 TIGR02678 family protein [Ornithinimicrobium sediminis]